MKTRTFRGLVFYQNLQKFTKDKRYAVESGPTDIITRQPLEGKSVDGGLRIGEINWSQSQLNLWLVCMWQATCLN